VYAVTAEPGTEASLKEAMTARGAVIDDLKVISDPSHGTCVFQDTVTKACKFKEWDYNMIQPMVVLLEGSTVLSVWNWKSPDQDTADANAGDELAAMTQVTGLNGTPLDKPAPLVTVRPACTDFMAAIKEKRPVKTEVVMRFD